MANYLMILTQAEEGAQKGVGWLAIVLYLVFLFGLMYFLLIRPQKKQQKKQEDIQNSIEPGDNIMTTSGFYGTVLDVIDEDSMVIVEFGNDKHCRIPMHKRAIAEIEKAGTAEIEEEDKK